jgi:hypothetical protein
VSITKGTFALGQEQTAGVVGSLATAAEQNPKLKSAEVAANVRASSTPKPFWPVSVSVKVQPGPGMPSTDVGTVIVTSLGVSAPEGDS